MKRLLSILLVCAAVFSIAFAQSGGASRRGRKPVDMQGDDAYSIKYEDTTALCLVGNVMFHHNGTVITCDSAVRYSERHMECFRNVLINKDSLYVYGDRAEYNGETNMAYVFSPLIKVVDGDATMYTYTFSFNTLDNVGRFGGGAILTKGDNRLEAERGYYYADSSVVICVDAVEMQDTQYKLQSDSVIYNLDTDVAEFVTDTYIWNVNNEMVNAKAGRYDRNADRFELFEDSYILTGKQEVWADSVDYRRTLENAILRRNIQIDDIDQKVLAFGDYGEYWGDREEALLTLRPSVISYDPEMGDSLFLRADSIRLFTERPYDVDSTAVADSLARADSLAEAMPMLDDAVHQQMAEAAAMSARSDTTAVEQPIADSVVREDVVAQHIDSVAVDSVALVPETELTPDQIKEQKRAESEARKAAIKAEKERVKAEKAKAKAEKAAAKEERLKAKAAERRAKRQAKIEKYERSRGIVRDSLAQDSLAADSLAGVDPAAEFAEDEMSDSLAVEADTIPHDSVHRIIRAYRNVRSYRKDFQSICDSMVVLSVDSTIHLYQSPILWYGSNQVTADVIDIFTANQQITRAEFTGNPIMAEQIDSVAYNQVAGKTIEALFRDNEIYRVNAIGNGQTLYYTTDENSGRITEFMTITCGDISFLLVDRKVETIIWRGNPVYSIYNITQVPEDQERTLRNFVWHGDKCPTMEQVFDRELRPSRRAEMTRKPQPKFPIQQSIDRRRKRLTESGVWRDRTETLSPDAVEFVESVSRR